MKYRLLSDAELHHLEGDLKAFLIVNGVEGATWKELNEQEPEKALSLVSLFSDQVLQTVYEKVTCLEHRSKTACLVFRFLPDCQQLIAIQSNDENHCDLTTPESIHEALTHHFSSLSFFKSEKGYSAPRETSIHELLEQGCVLSSMDFWNQLEEIISSGKKN
jgi:hypothetical protein